MMSTESRVFIENDRVCISGRADTSHIQVPGFKYKQHPKKMFFKLGLETHTCNSITKETMAGGSGVQGQLGIRETTSHSV